VVESGVVAVIPSSTCPKIQRGSQKYLLSKKEDRLVTLVTRFRQIQDDELKGVTVDMKNAVTERINGELSTFCRPQNEVQ
jgi:hypothetical protein